MKDYIRTALFQKMHHFAAVLAVIGQIEQIIVCECEIVKQAFDDLLYIIMRVSFLDVLFLFYYIVGKASYVYSSHGHTGGLFGEILHRHSVCGT